MLKFKTVSYVALSAVLAVGTIGVATLPMVAHANPASEAVAVKNLSQLLKNTRSMTANFNQTTKAGNKTQTFSGTMAVARPNQFRWQTTSPADQLIVASGSTMWVYDKDLQQATKQSTNNQVGDTPALLLSGDATQITRRFAISQPNAAKNYYVLTPKSGSANFKELSISFNGGRPVMMVLNDSIGQTTVIKFSNIVMNKSLSSSLFSFTPPAGTDIINQ